MPQQRKKGLHTRRN